jgi:Uma2 family endonuclease
MSTVDPHVTSPIVSIVPPRAPTRAIPLLQNGDRLTRREFERRYYAMPEIKKAELIEGIVYMPSPVRFTHHGEPHSFVQTWIGYYVVKTIGLRMGDNATSRLDDDNEPQPDVMLLLPSDAGSTAVIDEDGYVAGPPDLVCEVAASSVSIDLHAKLNAYLRNGVREYVVWRVEDNALDWFELVNGQYAPLSPDNAGVVRSKVFAGLWLNVPALLRGDLAAVCATVDAGVATPEHATLRERLATVK